MINEITFKMINNKMVRNSMIKKIEKKLIAGDLKLKGLTSIDISEDVTRYELEQLKKWDSLSKEEQDKFLAHINEEALNVASTLQNKRQELGNVLKDKTINKLTKRKKEE